MLWDQALPYMKATETSLRGESHNERWLYKQVCPKTFGKILLCGNTTLTCRWTVNPMYHTSVQIAGSCWCFQVAIQFQQQCQGFVRPCVQVVTRKYSFLMILTASHDVGFIQNATSHDGCGVSQWISHGFTWRRNVNLFCPVLVPLGSWTGWDMKLS